jgi:hypothetical protein
MTHSVEPRSKLRLKTQLLIGLFGLGAILGTLGLRSIITKRSSSAGALVPESVQPGGSSPEIPVSTGPLQVDAQRAPHPGSPMRLDPSPNDQAAVDRTRQVLAGFVNDALYGRVQLNAVLAQALDLASKPISQRPDFDYEDDDSIAYKFEDMPEGVTGHMLIGMQPYDENGRTYRYVQMQLDIATAGPEFVDGAMRDGPNINFSISYDVEDPNKPVRFALMLQRRVDLSASRKAGIDAYSGIYTQGAYYWQDFLPSEGTPSASTIGIVDGKPLSANKFPNAISLFGDLNLDSELLNAVLAQLQECTATVKGE